MTDKMALDLAAVTEWITPSEQDLIDRIKDYAKAELADATEARDVVGDVRILRFIRGNDGDFASAAEHFRKMLVWRKESGVDDLRAKIIEILGDGDPSSSDPNAITQYYMSLPEGPFFPQNMWVGWSPDGHLLQYELMGRAQPKQGMAAATKAGRGPQDFLNTLIMLTEYVNLVVDRASYEKKKLIYTVNVADHRGFGMKNLWKPGLEMFKEMLKMLKDNYPELLAGHVNINANIFVRSA